MKAIFIAVTGMLLSGCRSDVVTEGKTGSGVQGVGPVSDYAGPGRMFDVTWTCRGTGIMRRNKLSQEEYCEWRKGSAATWKTSSRTCPAAKAERGDQETPCAEELIASDGMSDGFALSGTTPSTTGSSSPGQAAPSAKLQCIFTTAFDRNRQFHMVSSINTYSALSGEDQRSPFNEDGTGGLFGPCFDEGLTCEEAQKSGLCVPRRASDPQVCAALNGLRDAGHRHLLIEHHDVIQIGSAQPGDAPVRMHLTFDSSIQDSCRYETDPNLPPGTPPDKTLVSCEVDSSQFGECDQLADLMTVHARVVVLDWDEVKRGESVPQDTVFVLQEMQPGCYVFRGSSPLYSSQTSMDLVEHLRVGDGATRLMLEVNEIVGERLGVEVLGGTANGKKGWLEFSSKSFTRVKDIYCDRARGLE